MSSLFTATLFAIVIGSIAALLSIGFIEGTQAVYRYATTGGMPPAAIVFVPFAAGVVCALIARFLNRQHFLGLADTVLLVQRDVRPRLRDNLASIAAAFVALCGGLSVGLYGPITHLGGSLGSHLRFVQPLRLTTACGAAGAIAAGFNAPITALVFAHELILRHYSIKTFTPVAISAIVGYLISVAGFARPTFLDISQMATLSPAAPLLFIAFGVLLGFLALWYLRTLFAVNRRANRYPLHWRLPLIGLLCGGILLAVHPLTANDPALLAWLTADSSGSANIGTLTLQLACVLLLAKLLATWLCLGGGFPGGIISPTLVIGGLLGAVFFYGLQAAGWTLGIPLPVFALCGMMAFAAPVIGAPLTTILFALELSGNYPISIVAAIVITISAQAFVRLRGRSYYDQQLAMRGYNLAHRRDEWRLHTTPVAALVRRANPLTADAQMTVGDAIAHAAHHHSSDLLVVDSQQRLLAHWRLADLLPHPPATHLDALTPPADLQLLEASDSIRTAMQKIAATPAAALPVVRGERLIGVISEGDLLAFVNQQVAHHRQEETAI